MGKPIFVVLWVLRCPAWLWLGGKQPRDLLASSRDFERPERAPRSLTETHVFRRGVRAPPLLLPRRKEDPRPK